MHYVGIAVIPGFGIFFFKSATTSNVEKTTKCNDSIDGSYQSCSIITKLCLSCIYMYIVYLKKVLDTPSFLSICV